MTCRRMVKLNVAQGGQVLPGLKKVVDSCTGGRDGLPLTGDSLDSNRPI